MMSIRPIMQRHETNIFRFFPKMVKWISLANSLFVQISKSSTIKYQFSGRKPDVDKLKGINRQCSGEVLLK